MPGSLSRLLRSLRRSVAVQPPKPKPRRAFSRGNTALLDVQLQALRERCGTGRELFIFLPSTPWRAAGDSRPQRFARALAFAGQLVVYDDSGTIADGCGLRELGPGLFLFRGPTRHLAALPNPVLWVTLDNVAQRARYPDSCRIVYDWTETPDVLRRIHEESLNLATVVVAALPDCRGRNVIPFPLGGEVEQAAQLLARL